MIKIKDSETWELTAEEMHSKLGLPAGWVVKGISSVNAKYHVRIEK